ncbi:MAG: SRPBCC domain-containing protein [Candidatus Eremiobacteraeota bacterium]|nr:SRPBCC domain-containing protein [Candidatus Eremiobacteraeota bacterium]
MIKDASKLVDVSIHIDAPQETVFKYLVDPELQKRWQPIDFFDPRIGGRYQFSKGEWISTGEIIELNPPTSLAYTWDWKNAPLGARTVVKFELSKDGNGTLVRLTHVGIPDEERVKNHAEGWAYYAKRLKIVAEGGDAGPDEMK